VLGLLAALTLETISHSLGRSGGVLDALAGGVLAGLVFGLPAGLAAREDGLAVGLAVVLLVGPVGD
jgi:hypothetical protein